MSEAELHVIKGWPDCAAASSTRATWREYRCVPANPPDLRRGGRRRAGSRTRASAKSGAPTSSRTFSRSWVRLQTAFKRSPPDGLFAFHLAFATRSRAGGIPAPDHIDHEMRTLHNPRYRGSLRCGPKSASTVGPSMAKSSYAKREPNDWLACIPDAHPRLPSAAERVTRPISSCSGSQRGQWI